MTAPRFARGASLEHCGVIVALALPLPPLEAAPPADAAPDARHVFTVEAGYWRLLDVLDLCDRHHLRPPAEFTCAYWRHAHDDRLRAAARLIARLRAGVEGATDG